MNMSREDENIIGARLFQVLQSPEVKRIDFTLAHIKVDTAGFQNVVVSLMLGTLHIGVERMTGGAAAKYYTHGNKFAFPTVVFGSDDSDKAYLVHESVHAMQDINYGNDFSRGDYFTMESENEAAAYVAGVLYDMYKNQDTHYTSATWLAAKAIALKIKDTPGAEVSDADVRTLRGVISGDPTYRSATFASESTYSDGAAQ
jgi:hypothetical protein